MQCADVTASLQSCKPMKSTLTNLIDLPKELLSHIASYCDAESVLQLIRTCRVLHTACYNAYTFRRCIETSQNLLWQRQCLDVEAIAERAGSSVKVWAQYAFADCLAWQTRLQHSHDSYASRADRWLPHLAVVKHPIVGEHCSFLPLHLRHSSASKFSLLLGSVLAINDCIPSQILEDMSMNDLQGLPFFALLLRMARRGIGPTATFGHHLDPLLRHSVSLRPLNGDYQLPVPFDTSDTSMDGKKGETMQEVSNHCSSVWRQWLLSHTEALSGLDHLMNGSWTGIYTYQIRSTTGSILTSQWDPPMTNMKMLPRTQISVFTLVSPQAERFMQHSIKGRQVVGWIGCLNCLDGLGPFQLYGVFYIMHDGDVGFAGEKRYAGQSLHGWLWECILTPFGLIGRWGYSTNDFQGEHSFKAAGRLWLVKEELEVAVTE